MYPSPFSIIRATPAHAAAVCGVLIRSIKEVCAPDYHYDAMILGDWLSNKTPENVRHWIMLKNNYSLAATHREAGVVGFSLLSLAGVVSDKRLHQEAMYQGTSSGEIRLLYVLPEYQQQGVGKKLLLGLEAYAKKQGVGGINTISTITAKAFYERNGFVADGKPQYVGSILGEFPLTKVMFS